VSGETGYKGPVSHCENCVFDLSEITGFRKRSDVIQFIVGKDCSGCGVENRM
jgi:hypothetical protein